MIDDRLSQTPPARAARRVRFRLPGPRAAWLVGAVALVGVMALVAFITAGVRSGETALAHRIESRLAARLHADVTVGEIRPNLDGGVVRDVSIRAPGGFQADAEEVRVPLDLWDLAADGGVPVRKVRLRGVTVVIDPRSGETKRWLRSVIGRPDDGAEADGKRGGEDETRPSGDARKRNAGTDLSSLDLEISDLTVKLLDAEGEARELLSKGAFEIERDRKAGAARATIAGSAVLAGGGRLQVEGSDRDGRTEIAASVSDLGTRWVAPLLPEGLVLRDDQETLLAGRIELSRTGRGEPWTGRGSFEAAGVTLASDRLADGPVRLPRLRLAVDRITAAGGERIELGDGAVRIGSGAIGPEDGSGESRGVAAAVDLTYEAATDGAHYRVEAKVPESACQGLAEVVPDGLLGDLDTMELGGTYSARALLDLDMADLDATVLDLSFTDHCRFLRMPAGIRAEALRRPFTLKVPAAAGGRTLELETGPGAPGWVPLDGVSRFVRQAVLAHEDATFYHHDGFAPIAIRNSLVEDLEAGRFVRGASTISMQLAKNLFLSRDKVLARKVREVFLTWWLERSFTKDEIFALYLNVIEYGPNLYGIGPASTHYFNASPDRLDPADAAFLATVLPAPKAYHRNFERGSLSNSTEAQMRFLLTHMFHKERIDREDLDWGLEALDGFRFGQVQPRPQPWIRWFGRSDEAAPGD